MWKSLSILSGIILLVAGGLMYTQVRNNLHSERAQQEAARENQSSSLKKKAEAEKAGAQAVNDLGESKTLLQKNTGIKNEALVAKDKKVQELEEATKEKDEKAKELADLEQRLKDLGGLERLVAELKVLEAKKAEMVKGVANTKDTIAATISHKEATEKVITGLKRLDVMQKQGLMDPGFRSHVAAVNPTLGFVVINAGNTSRVVRQAKLDVQRGGSTIAKVMVTHIEQNRSIADIIPGSMAAGQQVLPGDTVVVNPGSTPNARTAPKAVPTKKPGEAAPPAAPGETPADPFATPKTDSKTPAAPAEPMEKPATPAEKPATPPESSAAPAEKPAAPADPKAEKPADSKP